MEPETIATKSKTYPIVPGVDLVELSDETKRRAARYAQIVEDYDDPETFRNKGYTPEEWERRRTKAHNEYLEALRADGVDVSDRAATTGLALKIRRWLLHMDVND